jgi:muramoyltetrapeptide carboxypeptidase
MAKHAFKKWSYLAGRDEERMADFSAAPRNPEVRAIFATIAMICRSL